MKSFHLPTIAAVAIILFVYVLLTYALQGIATQPSEGDSLAYHIPIARTVLNGQFFHPTDVLGFYLSNVEVLLAFFILLHIPLNLFNVVAVLLLFFC